MHTTMPEAVLDLGASADTALRRAGGIDLARRAETDYEAAGTALDTLAKVGLHDIDPRADLDAAAAAAELCRVAGRHAVPCPVPGILLRDPADRPFAIVAGDHPIVDHAAAAPVWRAATLTGTLFQARPRHPTASSLSPFAMTVDLHPLDGEPSPVQDIRLALILGSFTLLGIGQEALDLAMSHIRQRTQFGHALSDFQVIRHSVADMSVGLEGLAVLCRFGLWRAFAEPTDSLADALAVRHEAQRVVHTVLRAAQQFHGAAGLAEEYDITILVRHAQPALRLPHGTTAMTAHLRAAIEQHGFEGPYAPQPS